MSRGKVITLVGLAVAVLLFDAWFFLGSDQAAAPIESFDEAAAADGGGFHLADLLPGTSAAPAPRQTDVPWHDPATWPLPGPRPPRKGRPRPGLMVRRTAAAGTGATYALPDRVPVILWRPDGALALLGDHLVREGDRVGPWVVREIHPDRVRLARADHPGETRELPLGRPARPRPTAAATGSERAAPVPADAPVPPSPPAPPARQEVP